MPSSAPDSRHRVAFDYDPEAIRSAEEPSESSVRLFWLFLELLRRREARYDNYYGIFHCDDRTFKRDIKKLRAIGARYGFDLTPLRQKVIRLKSFSEERRVPRAPDDGADALRALADAFGDVVTANIQNVVDIGGSSVDRFLRVASPRLGPQTPISQTFATLREAWKNAAMVRFRYPSSETGVPRERTVEPYATTYYNGRYYLVGYDTRPRVGWRQFALDRISGTITRAGTFRKRPLPEAYSGRDAIGLFKTGALVATEVTVELSPRIADAVTARTWQARQRVERRSDGGAQVSFEVYDLGEAIRWACGFGVEARVIAPPRAVVLARETVARMLSQYTETAIEFDAKRA